MASAQRARSNPGPLLLVAAGWLLVAGVVLRAHDPGLSSLDIRIAGGRLSALLSIAASDVALAAPGPADGTRRHIGELARTAIRLSRDGEPLTPIVDRVWMEEGAAYVQLAFPAAPLSNAQLTIRSDIPVRLARGHRQLLTVTRDEQTIAQRLLDASSSTVSLALGPSTPSVSGTASGLFVLGIIHILTGYDHLVFLAGLLLASRTVRELVTALTAFTMAHSLTLAMAAAGAVHAPPSIVEPLIAASIAWVGIETLMRDRRAGVRWIVVFVFGLVHGFGFAEALIDLGRWSSAAEVAVTVVSFNAGVEAGQVAVAAALLPLVAVVRRRPEWDARLVRVCSAMIACAGGYWLIERL